MSNIQFLHDIPIFPGMSGYVPTILLMSNPAQTVTSASTVDVTNSRMVIPKGFFSPGTCFKYTVWGNRTGTAGAATFNFVVNGTTTATVAVPTNTAVDYMAELLVLEYTDFAHQTCYARAQASATVLAGYDTAAATVDVSQETTISLQVVLANSSDDVIMSGLKLEYWNVS